VVPQRCCARCPRTTRPTNTAWPSPTWKHQENPSTPSPRALRPRRGRAGHGGFPPYGVQGRGGPGARPGDWWACPSALHHGRGRHACIRDVRAFRTLSGRSVLEPAERQPNRAHPLTAAMDVTASEGAQPLHRQAGTRPARAARPAWAPPAGFERCQWRAADCAHGCFSRHRSL
jgi:hypothetical protein